MNLEIKIPAGEPVRLLNAVLEEMYYSKLTATYSRLGRIEYSPRLLFKVVLYACTRGIYSSREIERACRENICFMWLLEDHNPPDYNTIIEANANRYSFVWKKAVSKNQNKLAEKIQAELPAILKQAGIGGAGMYNVQRLKKLRKQL